MIERMLGAARFDVKTYEEVEHDLNATLQALIVVLIVSVATGIGAIGLGNIGDNNVNPGVAFIIGIIVGLIQWAIWAGITYYIGTRLFPTPETHATWGQLARTTGFAQSPGVLKIFGIIPFIGPVIFYIATIWQLGAMVIAVRQALDYQSTLRAVGVVIVGWLVMLVVNIILSRFL